ncbi:MAG: hypothetical protein J7L38_06750, partial [Thermoproteales archaeon]|nr:hypothetical protein [Thermoproteales archaeon]
VIPPLIIPSPSWRDRDNGLVAEPLLLTWDGCRWEPRRAVNTQRMSTLEARIPLLQQGECQSSSLLEIYIHLN